MNFRKDKDAYYKLLNLTGVVNSGDDTDNFSVTNNKLNRFYIY